MGVPMGVGVQQAPMAMMQSGQPAWGQQQPQNGNHGGPAQIQHVIGTTPQMPEQQPAQNASNKAAPVVERGQEACTAAPAQRKLTNMTLAKTKKQPEPDAEVMATPTKQPEPDA